MLYVIGFAVAGLGAYIGWKGHDSKDSKLEGVGIALFLLGGLILGVARYMPDA